LRPITGVFPAALLAEDGDTSGLSQSLELVIKILAHGADTGVANKPNGRKDRTHRIHGLLSIRKPS
jgi:hypothetical protein